MSNEAISMLEDMEESLANDDYERFREQFSSMLSAYDEVRPAEREFVERAKAYARTDPAVTADTGSDDPVSAYLLEVQAANANRAGALFGMGVTIPNEEPAEDVEQFVTELLERERSLFDAREAAQSEMESVTVDALPRLYAIHAPDGPQAIETPVSIGVIVGNAGDTPASKVDVSLRTSNTVSVADENVRELTLDEGETENLTYELTPTESGTSRVWITLTYQDDEFVDVTEIETLSVQEFIDRADDRLGILSERIESVDLKKGAIRRLLSSVDAAGESLERASSALNDDRRERATEHVSTAINQLGALLNKLHAGKNGNRGGAGNGGNASTFSPKQRSGYVAITEEVIDLLTRARNGNRRNK